MATVIISLILIAVVVFIIRYLKNKGSCDCGGSCGGCGSGSKTCSHEQHDLFEDYKSKHPS